MMLPGVGCTTLKALTSLLDWIGDTQSPQGRFFVIIKWGGSTLEEVIKVRYWFTISVSLPEEVGKKLWEIIGPYKANLTILLNRTDIYGDTDNPMVIDIIAKALVDTGYPVERR